jgi:hypothetical protein
MSDEWKEHMLANMRQKDQHTVLVVHVPNANGSSGRRTLNVLVHFMFPVRFQAEFQGNYQ